MVKIGLLSDTHGYLHDSYFNFFKDCTQLWHSGDFGSMEVVDKLSAFKPLIGVYGNIDGQDIRHRFPLHLRFKMAEVTVWMTHIGGYPGRYDKSIKEQLLYNPPKLFISGHSHILKVIYDKKLKLLHINPGAAGKYGFHTVSTAVRFDINTDRIENLEIIEIQK